MTCDMTLWCHSGFKKKANIWWRCVRLPSCRWLRLWLVHCCVLGREVNDSCFCVHVTFNLYVPSSSSTWVTLVMSLSFCSYLNIFAVNPVFEVLGWWRHIPVSGILCLSHSSSSCSSSSRSVWCFLLRLPIANRLYRLNTVSAGETLRDSVTLTFYYFFVWN